MSVANAVAELGHTDESNPEAKFFALKAPVLSDGRLQTLLAGTSLLKVYIKIYANGGENGMHAHPFEDHAFIILQGQAEFHFGSEENHRIVNRYEGVMLPRGTFYRFRSSAEENLVMIRIGAETETPKVWRIHPDGTPFVANTPELRKENGYRAPVVVPGQFFGA